MWFKLTFLVIVLISVQANPIIIRSGIAKNQQHQNNANIFDATQNKGIENFVGAEGFNKDNERKYTNAEDAARFDEQIGKKKLKNDRNEFADEKFFQDGGGHVADFDNKVSHKKNHHKSGFHNTYHKDESGSNSSFFDDGDDEGDEYVHKTKKGAYGDSGNQRQQGANLDSQHFAEDQAKHGNYNNAGNIQKDSANNENYNRKKYYDNRENQNRRNAANQRDEGARFAEEKYYQRPQQYNPDRPDYYNGDRYYNNRPSIEKKHITIYEDPRVYDGGYDDYRKGYEYEQPHYSNDYVDIEVKRPLRDDYRYQYRRSPSFDYYY